MLSWRGLPLLAFLLVLPIDAFDPDLKTPLEQYYNPDCGGLSYYYDYQDYDDSNPTGVQLNSKVFLDTQVSLAPTHVRPSVGT